MIHKCIILSLALLTAAQYVNATDLLASGNTPGMTSAPGSGLNSIFGPLAGRQISCNLTRVDRPDRTLTNVPRACGRVLADGTPQVGSGDYRGCINWVNGTVLNNPDPYNLVSAGGYRYQLSTSGLVAWVRTCTGIDGSEGDSNGDCTGMSDYVACSVSW